MKTRAQSLSALTKERILSLRGKYSMRDIARICETSARTVGRVFDVADALAAAEKVQPPERTDRRGISVGRVQNPVVGTVLALRGKLSPSKIAQLLDTTTRDVSRIFDAADQAASCAGQRALPVEAEPPSEVEQLRQRVTQLEGEMKALATRLKVVERPIERKRTSAVR